MRVEVEQNEPTQLEEEEGKKDFRPSYIGVKEDNIKINEDKALEWMEADIKTEEVDISNDDRSKLEKIGDYWIEQQTIEIVNLLNEYQDVFVRD